MATEFPKGWDEARVRGIIDHYENQTEEEATEEYEAAFSDPMQTAMMVPRELVPDIMALIAKFDDEREAAEAAQGAR